jgi:anti-sigma regulatory factor (Ser/Thr protein kinase)
VSAVERDTGFRHEALLYAGDDEFVDWTSAFVREGVEAGEPVLVVVPAAKIEWLRERLNGNADRVCFADMSEVGRNPARLIPTWRKFVDGRGGGAARVRGIGEPIFPGRSPEAVVECQRHESLLNVAFAGSPSWWLLCPYDRDRLDPAVIEEARRSHPYVTDGRAVASRDYRGLHACSARLEAALHEPPPEAVDFRFDRQSLRKVREHVAGHLSELGFDAAQTAELVLAVHELAANSVRHGGGSGILRVWGDETTAVAEVTDAGVIEDPLAGRVAPEAGATGGYGLWLANHLCDLLEIRSADNGTTIRARLARR